jgi:hypothetical protein
MQMDPEPGKPQPELNPEARRILQSFSQMKRSRTSRSRRIKNSDQQTDEGPSLDRAFWPENQNLPCRFCNCRYSVGDAAGAYYADKRFWRLPSPIKVAGRSAFSEAMRKGKNFRASDKSGTNIGEFEVWPSDQQPPIPP